MENKAAKISGRQRLLSYFRNGKIPSEEHYSDLINSMVHKDDDGFSKDDTNGLRIYADEKYNSLISFYKNINAIDPFFVMAKDKADPDALKITPIDDSADPTDPIGDDDSNAFFLHTNGKLGIGKKCDFKYKMEVDGFVGMTGRIGTYKSGSVLADGKWYPIIKDLRNAQAFEIVARVGKKGTGKCAIMHATALSIFGPKGGKIRKSNAYFGWFWNRIHLRWTGDSTNYALEIKVGSNYGPDVEIFYTISRLWDDSLFLSEDYYYSDKT